MFCVVFFCLTQKTAYERRISYWSSDVCSADLGGLTGRKIIGDTYGGAARHGGGAFSGKDPSKVDRSAAYAARWVAKNVVAAGAATRCEVQVAYAIGVAQPVSIFVETFGSETVDETKQSDAVRQDMDQPTRAMEGTPDQRQPARR